MKPLLIIQTGSSYDDLPLLCNRRGDETQWFSEACGIAMQNILTVKVYLGEELPNPNDVQAIIITGSVYMVSHQLDWSEKTAHWLKHAISKNIPTLGVCYGHQLLAHALGGKVGPNPQGTEYGTVTVNKTVLAAEDKLLQSLPTTLVVQAAHNESVLRLPNNAVLLASNAMDKHHAFRVGNNAWGVQFHPEYDLDIMTHIYDIEGEELTSYGLNVEELRQTTKDSIHGQKLLQAFTKIAFN